MVSRFAQRNCAICTQLIGFKYCNVIPIIQFKHTIKEFMYCYLIQITLFNITHSCARLNGFKYSYVSLTIQLLSFVYTQLNDQTVLFLTIQINISHLFSRSKCQTVQFDHIYDPFRCYHSGPKWTWKQ